MRTHESLRTTALRPFGVEVEFDLCQGLSESQAELLKALHRKHKLLVFRRQSLTLALQQQVMSVIGRVDHCFNLSPDDTILGAAKLHFHSDLSFLPFPPEAISLHALDVNDRESSTLFVSSVEAYRRLPAALAERVRGLRAVAIANYGSNCPDRPPFETPPDRISFIRPVVPHHPETAEPLLFVSRQSTSRIDGLGQSESDVLLDELFAHYYAEDCVLKHEWCAGDFVMWDNWAVQHGRPSLEGVSKRTLQRVCNASHPTADQMSAAQGKLPTAGLRQQR